MRGIPSKEKVAQIIWTECGTIRASADVATSHDTYLHRLAVGLCIVNRGRQNLPWGDNQQTMAPGPPPTREQLEDREVAQQWMETQQAAGAAMATLSLPMDCVQNLHGAQLYVHTWTRAHTGPRLGGRFVVSYQAWDARDTRHRAGTEESGGDSDAPGAAARRARGARGPCPIWLSVHVIESLRDQAIRREASGRTAVRR